MYRMIHLWFISQWKWDVPLEDVTVNERESAEFSCVLCVKNVKVVWKVKGQEVEVSPKYAMYADGKNHKLVVSKCRPIDIGDISCAYGKIVTEAKLNVIGE